MQVGLKQIPEQAESIRIRVRDYKLIDDMCHDAIVECGLLVDADQPDVKIMIIENIRALLKAIRKENMRPERKFMEV